jgi:hypothetical protein
MISQPRIAASDLATLVDDFKSVTGPRAPALDDVL